MALSSNDNRKSWQGCFMFHERDDVNYPNGVQGIDGTIPIIYCHHCTPFGEVLIATCREGDVRAGKHSLIKCACVD